MVWAGDAGVCVVVVALDCEVVWAITGRDRARTTSDPRTKANSFFNIMILLYYVGELNDTAEPIAQSEHNCSLPKRIAPPRQ